MSFRVYLSNDKNDFVTVRADRAVTSYDFDAGCYQKLDLLLDDVVVASFSQFVGYVQNDNLI